MREWIGGLSDAVPGTGPGVGEWSCHAVFKVRSSEFRKALELFGPLAFARLRVSEIRGSDPNSLLAATRQYRRFADTRQKRIGDHYSLTLI